MALAYYQNAANYFAKALFPTCPVSLSSDNYYEFSKEDLLRDNWSRKPAYGKVDPTVVGESMKPYVCQVDQMIMGIDQIRQTDLSRRQGPTTMQPKQQRVKPLQNRRISIRIVCLRKATSKPVHGRMNFPELTLQALQPMSLLNSAMQTLIRLHLLIARRQA